MASKSKTAESGLDGRSESEVVEEQLDDLALKIDRIKTLYEQYFMGIEKIEPLVARKDITRSMLELQQMHIRNTGLRFRFNTLLQKWNIYTTYWNRTLREIENGTYVPHLIKAKRAAEREGKALPEELAHSLQVKHRRLSPPPIPADAKTHKRRPPPLPKAAGPPVPGISMAQLRALHKKYIEARTETGEDTSVSFEKMVESLARQAPKISAAVGVRELRFDVAVHDRRAVLRAIPKKR